MKRIPNRPKAALITLEDKDRDVFELELDGPIVAIRSNDAEILLLTIDLGTFIDALKELNETH